MSLKLLTYVIGFILFNIGFLTIILYINLFTFGYNFKEYIKYIIKLPEFISLILGFLLINLSIFMKGVNNEKRIWYFIEL